MRKPPYQGRHLEWHWLASLLGVLGVFWMQATCSQVILSIWHHLCISMLLLMYPVVNITSLTCVSELRCFVRIHTQARPLIQMKEDNRHWVTFCLYVPHSHLPFKFSWEQFEWRIKKGCFTKQAWECLWERQSCRSMRSATNEWHFWDCVK